GDRGGACLVLPVDAHDNGDPHPERFRYSEYACDLMVFRERNSSALISGNDRWVASSGMIRSSAAVRDDAPGLPERAWLDSRACSAWASPVRVPRSGRRLSSSSISRISVLAPARSA